MKKIEVEKLEKIQGGKDGLYCAFLGHIALSPAGFGFALLHYSDTIACLN